MELSSMNIEHLRALYSKKTQELREALLAGALWHEVRQQREAVTEIGIELQKKLQQSGNISPAEFSVRNNHFPDPRIEE